MSGTFDPYDILGKALTGQLPDPRIENTPSGLSPDDLPEDQPPQDPDFVPENLT